MVLAATRRARWTWCPVSVHGARMTHRLPVARVTALVALVGAIVAGLLAGLLTPALAYDADVHAGANQLVYGSPFHASSWWAVGAVLWGVCGFLTVVALVAGFLSVPAGDDA